MNGYRYIDRYYGFNPFSGTEHIYDDNKDLCEGKKVVVVAHSQGNLFANIAYKGINKDNIDGFGIVSVANPSGYVAGDSSDTYYTTIEEDKVIAVIPFALRANYIIFKKN